MQKIAVFLFGVLFITTSSFSQPPEKLSSSEIYDAVQKLNFLGTALYIAAHPDDENTRLISYLSNEVKARTAYLSITRGDGGQNLIGPELRELLGVLRTQELLAARNVDGGEQYFTRANDFGYSKHPNETLRIWDKEEVLGDVVWAIRKFRPDIIINRFDHRTPGSTHGHHTSSAMLSMEAFNVAANPQAYSKQLDLVDTWQTKRIFFNTSWWFYGSRENFEKADKSKMLNVDVGVYYPSRGVSNNEIAALASSQHLCQGFGRLSARGSQDEYIELIKGDLPKDKSNIFDGINTTWTRINGGEEIGSILKNIEANFNFKNPSVHINDFVKAYKLINQLENSYWREVKLKQIKNIILSITGLYLEAGAENSFAVAQSPFKVKLEVINRSNNPIELLKVETLPKSNGLLVGEVLNNNVRNQYEITMVTDQNSFSAPYWLMEPGTLGMYRVDSQNVIGLAETPRPASVIFNLKFGNTIIPFSKDVVYRYSRPDKGERYQPFDILPAVTTKMKDKVIVFTSDSGREIDVDIFAHQDNLSGSISLNAPEGWKVIPSHIEFKIDQHGDRKTVSFNINPPDFESEGQLKPVVLMEDTKYSMELVEIEYDHIPKQSVLLTSGAKVVHSYIEKAGNNIGYVMGAGDQVPESLRQMGYNVLVIKPEEISPEILSRLDAVVVGIRAYNVSDEFKFKQKHLLNFVEKGGNMIVQYNTGGRHGVDVMSPFPLKVSRDRVTDENSEVSILNSTHSLMNYPNKISNSDFEGWTQERGLYFPDEWSQEYTPVLSMHDEGEDPKNGSLLVAPYGKGYYIYTGLSFFRELPAGVPGAYKLFSNMLSIGKDKVKNSNKIKG